MDERLNEIKKQVSRLSKRLEENAQAQNKTDRLLAQLSIKQAATDARLKRLVRLASDRGEFVAQEVAAAYGFFGGAFL